METVPPDEELPVAPGEEVADDEDDDELEEELDMEPDDPSEVPPDEGDAGSEDVTENGD